MIFSLSELYHFFIMTISQIALMYAFKEVTRKSISINKKLIIIVIISSIIETVLSITISAPLNELICIFYFIIIYRYTTKMKIKDIIFYIIVLWLMGILIDVFIILIINILYVYMPFINPSNIIVRATCSIILPLIIIALTKTKIIKKIVDKAHTLIEKLNMSYIHLLSILILYFSIGTLSILNSDNKQLVLSLLILSILLLLTIIQFVKNKYDIITLKEMNDHLMQSNDFYLKLIEDYRILKHNLTSQLLGVKSVSNKKAKELIDDIIKDYNATFQTTQNIKDIPPGINGIVYEKLYNFNNKELKVSVDNKIEHKILDVIKPHSYNLLCEALGVTIDNAMEAAANSKNKIIYLNFKENRDSIRVIIINSFSGVIDLEKLGTKNYTSKKKGHGIGLYSLINRKKVQIKTSIKNNLFINEIIIEKQKN